MCYALGATCPLQLICLSTALTIQPLLLCKHSFFHKSCWKTSDIRSFSKEPIGLGSRTVVIEASLNHLTILKNFALSNDIEFQSKSL